jgi:hypothetical protein
MLPTMPRSLQQPHVFPTPQLDLFRGLDASKVEAHLVTNIGERMHARQQTGVCKVWQGTRREGEYRKARGESFWETKHSPWFMKKV